MLSCLAVFSYRWISFHIWFPLNDCNILADGKFSPMFYDYLPSRSLSGEILLRNQDHGTQFLISIVKKEVSVISEDEDFLDVVFLTYTQDDITNLENSKIKQKLLNPNLIVGEKFVEFTSKGGERWHISY